ncbi:enzymatic polyprotein, partial [Trifolium medium]|nr:enzymatic polyprotein [Trifolium medium]
MKLEGGLMGIHVQVLVDSGASHCSIDSNVAAALGLVVETNAVLGVKLGD